MTTDVAESPLTLRSISVRLMAPVIVAWSLLVIAGLCALWCYGSAPGDSSASPKNWPTSSTIARNGCPTLLLFAHPQCPCTRATLAEFERLLAVSQNQCDAHILFIAPDGTDSSWRDSELYKEAHRIPSVDVQEDVGRREAKLFGAKTSGTCLLYDAAGRLQFQGGLTAARGHEGDNQGVTSIKSLLQGKAADSKACVFGCPLYESEGSRGK